MKKKYSLILLVFLCFVVSGYGQMSDLIISEYGEGSSNNKYVEIYNGTGSTVNLSDYELWKTVNTHPTWPEASISLSGTLANGDVYIVANGVSNPTILAAADITDGFVNWNGNDAVGLAKDIAGTFTLIDAIGTNSPDPGAGWNVAGTTNATANHTLVRKSSICDPNTNWTVSAGTNAANSEWIVFANDTWTDLGMHTETCSSTNTLVEFTTISSSLAEDGISIDICVTIANSSVTTATTVDITLDGSSTATNGTDYDNGAGTPVAITFPQTLTFPANSSANQCLTIFISNDDLDVEGDETVVLNLTNPNGGNSAALGTDTQHILTIMDNDAPTLADVVITEIMYNTAGVDDEWIEICNTSGSNQVLNDYSIRFNGSIIFTFPSSGIVIADNSCITISLGSDGDGTFNNLCPFTPDYSVAAGNTDNLFNTQGTVTMFSNSNTLIDSVFYDDNDSALTDGNGSSFHVIDDSLDNSDTNTNWQAVANGGSPGVNSLISPCSPLEPEINVEGDIGGFPNIMDGDTTPSFLDNTQFSGQIVGVGSQTKSFIIENLGFVDLLVSNIQIIGANAADFTVTLPSALPLTITPVINNEITFDITFAPLSVAGIRNATIRITNNDSADGGGEEIYEFAISGEAICDATSNVLTPLTGPINTIVSISGSDLGGSTSVTYDGVVIPHTVISPTEIEITIPTGAVSANIIVTNNINCQSTNSFTIIDNAISSCEGNGGVIPSDLFISEVTDKGTGSHSYIEIYNGTGATVNLADYEIRIHNNGNATAGGAIADLTSSMPNNTTYVVAVGGSNATDPEGGFNADEFYGFGGINDNDNIRLYFNDGTNPETWVDLWGDTSGITFTVSTNDYTYRRKNTGITVPSTTWNPNDWDSSTPVDYSDIGTFDFSTGVPPTVTLQPIAPAFACAFSATLTTTGAEGFNGGGDTQNLAYQWYFNAPGSTTWTEILPGNTNYMGQQTATLTIVDTSNLDRYQYYCQIRENSATCFVASNALKLEVLKSVWTTSGWSSPPGIDRVAIIDDDYNTSVGGANNETSFEACRCIVNTDNELTIANNTFVRIDTDLTVNGTIVVQNGGSFVQINDTGIIDGSVLTTRDKIRVEKLTSSLGSFFEYTYWSSPVSGELISNGLFESYSNRIFSFSGQNFLDATRETNNDNTTVAGQDDIDDNADDWQFASGSTTMQPGVGYASTHNTFSSFPGQFLYIFEGPFNNGVYNIPIYRNDSEMNDNNWNFIGNPYPSAIDADLFLAANTNIDQNAGGTNGAIFFWSHNTVANSNTNGNENYNYAQSDYAIINGSGQTMGGDMVMPTRHIPSGQGFFVSMDDAVSAAGSTIKTTNVLFNNSMRITGSNNQFFRNSGSNNPNKLWVNLTSDNGVFNQILVAYVAGATDDDDGMYYDAHKNLSSDTNSALYSIIKNTNDKKFAIQGKEPNSLTLDEVIYVGFNTSIDVPTIYSLSIHQIEGAFMSENTIYLRDNLLSLIHDLSLSDYSFTSETGEFNDRFEIVFTNNLLSINDHIVDDNDLTITESVNGDVQFTIGKNQTIMNVKIIDVLGRVIYNLNGNNSTEVYNLSNLSKAAYIAKVTLLNGQVLSKKAIKQY